MSNWVVFLEGRTAIILIIISNCWWLKDVQKSTFLLFSLRKTWGQPSWKSRIKAHFCVCLVLFSPPILSAFSISASELYSSPPSLLTYVCACFFSCGHVSLSYMWMYGWKGEAAEHNGAWHGTAGTLVFSPAAVLKNQVQEDLCIWLLLEVSLRCVPFCPLAYISFSLSETPTIQSPLPYCWNLSSL